MNTEYDILIVGSGAGGGTVADRLAPLAAAGARIAVLESGPHYTRDYFTQREIEMVSLLWQNGAWPTKDGSITLAAGRGVGGSTMMYTGVTFRLPEEVLAAWNVPGLDAADMRARFERLEREVNATAPTEDLVNDNNRLFRTGCERLGYALESLKINVRGCRENGFCNVGCVSGGKQSTLEVQLPRAQSAGIEILPNCHVHRVGEQSLAVTVSPAPAGTRAGTLPPGEHTLRAKTIVLAAGTPGTPALLLRSGYGEHFADLGRYITLHPALTVYGVYPEEIRNYRGFPKTFFTPQFSESHGYYIETAFYYPFVSTKHLGLWGAELRDLMRAYTRFMTAIILVHDEARAENRVELDKQGHPVIDYTLDTASIAALCHAQASAARIFFAAGCEKVVMPCAERPVFGRGEVADAELERFISPKHFQTIRVPIASAHLQGGCRMGADAGAVTDAWGQVQGRDWLYIADGSLFPQSSHVNPFLTIMALAERVAERVREQQGARAQG